MFTWILLAFFSISTIHVVDADEDQNCQYSDRCPYHTGFIPFRRNDTWWCSKAFSFPTGNSPVPYQTALDICDMNQVALSSIETLEELDYYHRYAVRFRNTAIWLSVGHDSLTGQYFWDDCCIANRTIEPQPTNVLPGYWPAYVWEPEYDGTHFGHFAGASVDGINSPVNMVLCGYPGFGPPP